MAKTFNSYKLHINAPKPPCWNNGKDCEDRDGVNCCHSYCESYIEWEKAHNEFKKKMDDERIKRDEVSAYNIERSRKVRKEYRR